MVASDPAINFYAFCARHRILRPVERVLKFLYPFAIAHEKVSSVVDKITRDPGLPCRNPTTSIWQYPPHVLSAEQSVTLQQAADVVIIGSGITAASIAYHLLTSDPNLSVAILEARQITSGATGRNGGHILELPYEEYESQRLLMGKQEAKRLIQFRLDHLPELLTFTKVVMTEQAAKASEVRVVDSVDAVFDEQQWMSIKSQLRLFLNDFPEQEGRWAVWEKDDARNKFGMPDICGAITGPGGAIWPYRFVTSVFESLVSQYTNRISIETNTPVLKVQAVEKQSKYPYVITTSRGSIESRHVVHATNGHAAHLLPRMQGKIFPLRGQMTVQQYTGPSVRNMGNERSWQLRHGKGFDYMTQNAESGLFFLGGGTFQGGNGGLDDVGNPADDEQNFLARCHLTGLLPRLFGHDAECEKSPGEDLGTSVLKSSWTGVMGFSCDGRPWVGKLSEKITGRQPNIVKGVNAGEWIAAGFCGSGMVYCWGSGRAVSAMIREESIDWFPETLLPTEARFRRSRPKDIATYFFELSA